MERVKAAREFSLTLAITFGNNPSDPLHPSGHGTGVNAVVGTLFGTHALLCAPKPGRTNYSAHREPGVANSNGPDGETLRALLTISSASQRPIKLHAIPIAESFVTDLRRNVM